MGSKQSREGEQRGAPADSDHSGAPAVNDAAQHEQPHAKRATTERQKDEDSPKDQQFRKVNMILMLVFTGALVLVNIVYAYFAGGQWQAMDDSLKEIRQNRELEYRAYIGARGASFTVRPDNP